MPTYEFQCTKCGKVEDRILTLEEMEALPIGQPRCPWCVGPTWRVYTKSPFIKGDTVMKGQR